VVGDGFRRWASGHRPPASPAWASAVHGVQPLGRSGVQGEAATTEGINAALTILSPAPPRMGLRWPSLVPRTPVLCSQPLREGSLLLLLLLLGSRCKPRPPSPNSFPTMEGQCGWEGRGFSGPGSHPLAGGAAPSCPAIPDGLSSSQSRGVAQIRCGLAAAAGLGFR